MILSLPTDKDVFSIGEVSRFTGIAPHVLRYWESAIGAVRPARRGSGHRRFSRKDVEGLLKVRELVRDRGLTLAGAKKKMRADERRRPEQMALALSDSLAAVALLKEVRAELALVVKDLRAVDTGA